MEIQVRDMRHKEKFFVDDEYLNGYAKYLGPSASMVYFALCRYADKYQECFPAQETIAAKLGITSRTVITSIKKLCEWNIIKKLPQRKGKGTKFKHNVYVLLDKNVWKSKPSENISHGDQVKKTTRPSEKNSTDQVKSFHTKDTHIRIHIEGTGDVPSQDIAELIKLFETLEISAATKNWYANKTQRKAMQSLLKQFGREQVEKVINLLPKTNKQKYMPRVTTPHQLEQKWFQLRDALIVKKNEATNTKPKVI